MKQIAEALRNMLSGMPDEETLVCLELLRWIGYGTEAVGPPVRGAQSSGLGWDSILPGVYLPLFLADLKLPTNNLARVLAARSSNDQQISKEGYPEGIGYFRTARSTAEVVALSLSEPLGVAMDEEDRKGQLVPVAPVGYPCIHRYLCGSHAEVAPG